MVILNQTGYEKGVALGGFSALKVGMKQENSNQTSIFLKNWLDSRVRGNDSQRFGFQFKGKRYLFRMEIKVKGGEKRWI